VSANAISVVHVGGFGEYGEFSEYIPIRGFRFIVLTHTCHLWHQKNGKGWRRGV